MLTPEKVHVLARRMVDVSMIDVLLCFSVGWAGGRASSTGQLSTVNKEKTSTVDKRKICSCKR